LRQVCCGEGRGGAFRPEDDMTRSTVLTLALSALVASGIASGAAQAQTTGGPAATEPAVMVPAAAVPTPLPPTIAPSSLFGAGPPTDGLDSHPYREREMHKAHAAGDKSPQSASGAGGKPRQQARGATKTSGSGTTN
jgi:hypothetical protein